MRVATISLLYKGCSLTADKGLTTLKVLVISKGSCQLSTVVKCQQFFFKKNLKAYILLGDGHEIRISELSEYPDI